MAAWWAEWSSYGLSDFLLFSPATYLRLIELYNAAIWPAQVLAVVIGVVILLMLRRPSMMSTRAIALLLALAWAWVGWAFQLGHYATINWAAPWFAAAFACQAGLLLWYGLARGRREVTPNAVRASVGQAILAYALFIHPLIGLFVGRSVSQLGVFGSMPDPTVLATLGVVLALRWPSWVLLPIPLLWCAIGAATLLAMNDSEAWVMPAVAFLTVATLLWRR